MVFPIGPMLPVVSAGGLACFAGVKSLVLVLRSRFDISRDELENRVAFLSSVPLFRRQLPRGELPHLARALRRRFFRAGRLLVREGDASDEFFLIESGEAQVVVDGEERGVLAAGDHWGDASLIRCSRSPATIEAIGPGRVAVLTLTKSQFERLGLHERLSLPKRTAVYNGVRKGVLPPESAAPADSTYAPLPPGEEEFICNAFRRELSLREVAGAREEAKKEMARTARIRTYAPGTDVVRCGDFSKECFVIKSGEVEVFPEAIKGPRSAAFVVAISDLRRKYAKGRTNAASECAGRSRSLFARAWSRTMSNEPRRTTSSRSISSTGTGSSSGSMLFGSTLGKGVGFHRSTSVGSPTTQQAARGPEARLSSGDVFGHITMFHNAHYAATFRAAGTEPVVLYVIARSKFKAFICNKGTQHKEWSELLDEAPLFAPLFRTERKELARNASGYKTFKPMERVIRSGKICGQSLWYVVATGSGVLTSGADEARRVQLRRGDAFGERGLLVPGFETDYSVQAGDTGMVCLCLDVQVLLSCGLSKEDLHKCCSSDWLKELEDRRGRSKEHIFDPAGLVTICGLGTGSFGFVVLQQDPHSGHQFALKRMSKGLFARNQRKHIAAERDLMSLTDSDFVVRLYYSWKDEQFLYLLQEAALGGSLAEFLHRNKSLFLGDSGVAQFYVACALSALEHLHERSILYRDLKPENVLLDTRGYAKLCDMGFARFSLGKTYTCCGTPEYMAPEVIDFSGYSFPVDWWSLGVLTCELLTGHEPWEVEYSDDDTGAWIGVLHKAQERGIPYDVLPRAFRPPQAAAFVRNLLRVRVSDRLGTKGGATSVKNHRWFTESKFSFDALLRGELTSPKTPPPFEPEGPVPDLERQVPITYHRDCSLLPGMDLYRHMVTPQQAVEMIAADDRCEACCYCAAVHAATPSPSDASPVESTDSGVAPTPLTERKVLAHFKAQSAAVKQPGWVTLRKRPELFKHHVDDGCDWDKTFALPDSVQVSRKAKSHSRPDELW